MGSRKQNGRPNNIYLIRHGDTDLYKIGIGINPIERLATLQIGNPIQLSIVGFVATDQATALERLIHKFVKQYHTRGEWFKLSDEQFTLLFEAFGFTEVYIVVPDNSTHPSSKQSRY